jgi:hypothetical protein
MMEFISYILLSLFLIFYPIYIILIDTNGPPIYYSSPLQLFIGFIILIITSYFLFGITYPYFNGFVYIDSQQIRFRDGIIFRKLYSPMITINIMDIHMVIKRKRDSVLVFEKTNRTREVLDLSGVYPSESQTIIEHLKRINEDIISTEE